MCDDDYEDARSQCMIELNCIKWKELEEELEGTRIPWQERNCDNDWLYMMER